MFNIDTTINERTLREKNLIKAFFSMNNHQVATPEMILEEARSYVLFARETGGGLSSFIGIHLLHTGRKLFYSCGANPFADSEMGAVEEEALIFAEGLGAMLDVVDISLLSDDEKERWLDTQDIFSVKPEPPAAAPQEQPAAQPAPEQAAPQLQTPPPPDANRTEENKPGPVVSPEPQQPPAPAEAVASPPRMEQPAQVPVQPPTEPETELQFEVQVSTVTAPSDDRKEAHETPAPANGSQRTPLLTAATAHTGRSAVLVTIKTAQPEQTGQKPQEAAPQENGGETAEKSSAKNEAMSANGVVNRDKEALARLLASF